jgi:hypothetical protein
VAYVSVNKFSEYKNRTKVTLLLEQIGVDPKNVTRSNVLHAYRRLIRLLYVLLYLSTFIVVVVVDWLDILTSDVVAPITSICTVWPPI